MIPLSRPSFGPEEAAAVGEVLETGWVSQGPKVADFERSLADFVSAPAAIAVSSCTAALHLAAIELGIGDGDEVILPSHSFIATANAITYCGATPVFVDIDPATYNIDPALVAGAVSEKTKAILCAHQLGMPCDLPALAAIAGEFDLRLIEDAACALGSEFLWERAWRRIGMPVGDVACFSFHGRKPISTGEGGMLTTRNLDSADRFRILRHHGMSIPDTVRHKSATAITESYDLIGYNYRLSDIQAAVGEVQMDRLPTFVKRRREIANLYSTMLESVSGVEAPHEPTWARSNWQSYCVRLSEGIKQRPVIDRLRASGIVAKGGVICSHREPAYSDNRSVWRRGSDLSESEKAQDGALLLPIYHGLSDSEVKTVVETLKKVI